MAKRRKSWGVGDVIQLRDRKRTEQLAHRDKKTGELIVPPDKDTGDGSTIQPEIFTYEKRRDHSPGYYSYIAEIYREHEITSARDRYVLGLHAEGLSEREIEEHLKLAPLRDWRLSDSGVRKVIERVRTEYEAISSVKIAQKAGVVRFIVAYGKVRAANALGVPNSDQIVADDEVYEKVIRWVGDGIADWQIIERVKWLILRSHRYYSLWLRICTKNSGGLPK